MEKKGNPISDRLLDYGAVIIKICLRLNRTAVGKHIGKSIVTAKKLNH